MQTTFASNDRLVVGNYANSDAEAITGQTLVNLLATSLDGHGGIQSIAKTGSSGTDPVVDVYTITMADQSTATFTVKNGLKGDQGLQTFVYFRWAHTQPSAWSDTTDQPDEWMGVYAGTATTPPTTVSAYTWVRVRGDTGETGAASAITEQSVTYMESTSGTIVPSGSWSPTIPQVTAGNFLWTKTYLLFNDGSVVNSYSVSRFGIDGTGSVSSVSGVSPDSNGNVPLRASNIPTDSNQSVQVRLNALGTLINSIPNEIAHPYSSLSTYAVGDICNHNDSYYICNTAISTPEAWNDNHWTSITIGSQLTDLNAALNAAVLQAAEQTITSSTTGTSAWITLTGLTADHVVGNWGLRDSNGAIPENAPPCDIEIETAAGQWRYTLTTNSTAFYLKPTFILKQN